MLVLLKYDEQGENIRTLSELRCYYCHARRAVDFYWVNLHSLLDFAILENLSGGAPAGTKEKIV